MKLWKATFTCTLSLILLAFAAAQEKPETFKPLTDQEKIALRNSQVKKFELMEQKKALDAQLDAAIAEADKGTAETVNAVYAARKITPAEAALCDNPTPGPCAKAPAGELTLQPISKEVKK